MTLPQEGEGQLSRDGRLYTEAQVAHSTLPPARPSGWDGLWRDPPPKQAAHFPLPLGELRSGLLFPSRSGQRSQAGGSISGLLVCA